MMPTHVIAHVFVRDAKRQTFANALSGRIDEASIPFATIPGGAAEQWDDYIGGNGLWWCASWRVSIAVAMNVIQAAAGSEAWWVAYTDTGIHFDSNYPPVPDPVGPVLLDAATALGLVSVEE
jgi:hypothetical protein